ncbi:MAG: TIM barrel protein [Steroidobacteraceae bacterium]|nr:TIM barrel protein [Steroidobacteraceae bacterium]MDW8259415.1 TIM barrel protein [Gammaproteobacteria bacterium]
MGLTRQQVGVQAHCLRRELAADFVGTLRRLRALEFDDIELCHFPGFAGSPWGDFGALAAVPPAEIRAMLLGAGLSCAAVHVRYPQLLPDRIAATVRWTLDVGSATIVLASLPLTTRDSLANWRDAFESLNRLGAELAAVGCRFAYHTQNDLWQTIDGRLLADELLRCIDPSRCLLELDPSGALLHGVDWRGVVRPRAGMFFAMHLRDGAASTADVAWAPAVPLGDGIEDWREALQTAAAVGIEHYFLEMEVAPGCDVIAALQKSLDYLRV